MQGYNELRESAAWVDVSTRGKIRMTGEDRVRLLHAMCTNNIEVLKPGEGCYAFLLNAQGRILADVNVLCHEDSLLLDTETETRQKILEHLDQYLIADDVTLEDVTTTVATIAVSGPKAAPPPAVPALRVYPDTWHIFISAEDKDAMAASLFLPQADAEAARTVRIEQGRPRYGEEITERYLVQETGEMRAVSFTKGCYLGQEIVERVRSRGQVHRHLLPVRIATTKVPEAGTKLTGAEGKDLGEIASAVWSPAFSQVAAMAYLRTDAAAAGFQLDVNGAAATVVRGRSS
jgi:tRNA-modifying protein YgfZ